MQPHNSIGLVIFDCDGVLVDSEWLGNRVLIEFAYEFGLRMTIDEAMNLFHGCKMIDCIEEIERRIGKALPTSFVMDYRRRAAEVFQRELRPIDGVMEALNRITLPMCVASNGPPDKLAVTLRTTGLAERFAGRVFSAYEVNSWKPEPSLFLHAAHTLGVPPSQCVVVEDSVLGIQAAVAAGMRVLGFVPAHAHADTMRDAGAVTFSAMRELPDLLFDYST